MGSGNLLIRMPPKEQKANFRDVAKRIVKHFRDGGRGAIYDLDGTLINARKANAMTVLEVLEFFKCEPCKEARENFVAICSGPGPEKILKTLVPSLANEPEKLAAMMEMMYKVAPSNVKLITATPLVDTMGNTRIAWSDSVNILATNRNKETTGMIVNNIGIGEVLDVLMWHSSKVPRKPMPTMLNIALWKAGLDKNETIHTGDTSSDRLAAKGAGLKGYNHVKWQKDSSGLFLQK